MIVGDEPHRPYNRIPLSKGVLTGDVSRRDLPLRTYTDLDATWRLGTCILGLDLAQRHVVLPGGEHLRFDGLVIATGVEARHLPDAPLHLLHVRTLRTLDDSGEFLHSRRLRVRHACIASFVHELSVSDVQEGGPYTRYPYGATPTLPNIFAHRDVGDTACPGSIGYGCLDEIRAIAARFDKPASSADLAESMRGTAIWARWQAMGGMHSSMGAPTSPETPGSGSARYVTFDKGAIYYSPTSGAAPVTGAIYDAWATLGFERGELGLPTSGEIQEPLWIGQKFQHGTLNIDRQTLSVTRVIDGVALILPPPPPSGPPVQMERFSPARNRV